MREMIVLLSRREAGSTGAGTVIALAFIAALAGMAATRFLELETGMPARGGVLAITRFDATAAIVLALLAAVRLTARPAEDHVAGWLHAFVGSGGSRGTYLTGLYLAVTGSAVAALALLIAVFAAVILIGGGGTSAAFRAPEAWLAGSLLIASFGAFGLAAGVLVKDSGAAMAMAIVAFVLPFAIAVTYALSTDNSLPRWFRLAGFAHVPPLALNVTATTLLHHAVYLGIAGLLARMVASRLVGRW
jgi:hypothetical protein